MSDSNHRQSVNVSASASSGVEPAPAQGRRGEDWRHGLWVCVVVIGWLLAGAALGAGLAYWQSPGSDFALMASALLFPLSVLLGWLMMFVLALLALPFLLPKALRHLARHGKTPALSEEQFRARQLRIGWVFVIACLPTSLIAGLIAGAPLVYLLAGLGYGLAMRRSRALQEVEPG